MTTEVLFVAPMTPLEEIVTLMEGHHVKRVPVLQDDRLVGIVTRADLLKAFLRLTHTDVSATDEDIQARILAEISKQSWAHQSMIDISVKDGAVELRGTILDERFRDALRVIAENAPGEKSVTDHLMWLEPISGVVLGPEP